MISTEQHEGTECTGTDGTTGRTLTLSNTNLTIDEGLDVFVGGIFLHISDDFTIVHNTSASVITFLTRVFDESHIAVTYQT